MSIAYEINRLQTSKADTKEQVNIDKDYINAGIDFIDEETLDDYADLIKNMQDAYKQYIPINSTSDTQIEAPKGGAIMGKTIKGNTSQNGTPTPSSPVPVNNVTGLQTITISNGTNSRDYEVNLGNIELNKIGDYQDFIRKGTGKNLLQTTRQPGDITTTNGVTFTCLENGLFKVTGTATANTSYVIANQTIEGLRELLLSGDYYLSGSPKGSTNSTYRLQVWGASPSGSTGIYCYENGVKIDNFKNETVGFNIALYINSGQTVNIIFKPQLEKGSVTSYEPYGYKDKWYVGKYVDKVTINGQETGWLKSNNAFQLNNNEVDISSKLASVSVGSYCNSYKFEYWSSGITSNLSNNAYGWNANKYFTIRNDTYANVNDFKTYLENNTLWFYIPLATPTFTEITNTILLNQLERIMQLYEGQNNILVTGDLAATLDLDYIVKAENHL